MCSGTGWCPFMDFIKIFATIFQNDNLYLSDVAESTTLYRTKIK